VTHISAGGVRDGLTIMVFGAGVYQSDGFVDLLRGGKLSVT